MRDIGAARANGSTPTMTNARWPSDVCTVDGSSALVVVVFLLALRVPGTAPARLVSRHRVLKRDRNCNAHRRHNLVRGAVRPRPCRRTRAEELAIGYLLAPASLRTWLLFGLAPRGCHVARNTAAALGAVQNTVQTRAQQRTLGSPVDTVTRTSRTPGQHRAPRTELCRVTSYARAYGLCDGRCAW